MPSHLKAVLAGRLQPIGCGQFSRMLMMSEWTALNESRFRESDLHEWFRCYVHRAYLCASAN